jgi:phosphatidylglycerol:prolipoprotein diacylglycerol transferase
MHPILLQLGPLTLRTYGALIALAFLGALRLAKRGAEKRAIPEKFLMDLAIVLVFAGIIGARLLYVLLNASFYLAHPLDAFKVWEGGLVFYGGFLTAAAAGVVYARRHKVPVAKLADCLAPALALGQGIGRWGCFLAGCCYGKPTTLPWSVTFNDAASLAPLNVPLHPTQLYEALGNLVIAWFLFTRLVKKPDAPQGQVFWLYVLCYGLLRFAVEIVRGDDRGPMFADLYPSQLLSIVAVLVSASILIAQITSDEEIHGAHAQDRKSR